MVGFDRKISYITGNPASDRDGRFPDVKVFDRCNRMTMVGCSSFLDVGDTSSPFGDMGMVVVGGGGGCMRRGYGGIQETCGSGAVGSGLAAFRQIEIVQKVFPGNHTLHRIIGWRTSSGAEAISMYEERQEKGQPVRGTEAKSKMIIDVHTGEVEAGGKDTILRSNAIASCVVIAAYDPTRKVGALAHVMVPGTAPDGRDSLRTRYAADAIEEMMKMMIELGTNKDGIEVCVVGGGNVLKREDDTIYEANFASVQEILDGKHIEVRAEALGGTQRRSISLDVEKGSVRFTVGDGKEQLLWKTDIGPSMKGEEE